MSGRSVTFFDDEEATQYSWGGDVNLESSNGNIRQNPGSIIDVSAQHNQAGRLTAIALADSAGVVDLQGQIHGGTSGYYEAGGTYVPYLGGGIVLCAPRSEEHTSELQSLMRRSYADFCLKKKKKIY